jgi:F-type H+-transporting ATPase subunit b
MFKLSILILFSSLSLLASGGEHSETNYDIVERVFNFVVFAGILYYLIAEPIKKFLEDRTLSIENEFKRNEKRLEESKLKKEKAQEDLVNAKRQAGMIVTDAKKEAQLSVERLEGNFQSDIATLEKQSKDLMELEESKMIRSVVDEVIRETLSKGDLGLDEDSLSKALVKKVS